MWVSAGANVWNKVERVMGDRRISCKRKGNVLSSCVTPAFMNALETMATNLKNKTGEYPGLRVKVGVNECSKKKLVLSTWAGHV